MKDRDDIEERYEQYRCHELPGQPMGAHMGTVYLMNDLHTALVETEAERDRLREAHKRVIMHTARVPNTTDVELLNKLLDSCGRISLAALQETGDE